MNDFRTTFQALTGHPPFPWQRALYDRFIADRPDNIPASCNLPTGVGKTSVIAIWLIALAHGAKVSRRLVYVVNRRTVVDQTTNEAMRLFENAQKIGIDNLAISTLRGQFADNRAWSADPSRPAIICGTVDMIGSRLLFSGYNVGFKSRPLHAGFLGQDVLLVHDEAHLEPAFQHLIESIKSEQKRCCDFAAFHVMEMTATTRSGNGQKTFTLDQEDYQHPVIKQRIEARKQLTLTPIEDEKKVAEKVAKLALGHKDANAAVLVFVRTIDDVMKVCATLTAKNSGVTAEHVQQLTGTMRGLERDRMAKCDPVFMRFLPEKNRNPDVKMPEGTVYLVCTSAGEVGIDISADHMVCDLSTFESMAQRFGRVNRYGEREDTCIDVVHPSTFDDKDKLTPARKATLELLRELNRNGNASPKAVGDLMKSLTEAVRTAAFAPPPAILPATDILFDAWSLTSIRQPMPGRPPVEPYLRGIAEWQPPETHVAWRKEVDELNKKPWTEWNKSAFEKFATELLDDYPLKPHELLRDRSDRVFKQLETLAKRHAEQPVWIIDAREAVEITTFAQLADKQRKDRINGCTILLPPSVGGLTRAGTLDGGAEFSQELHYDIADVADGPDRRIRAWSDDPELENKTDNMRRVRSIELDAEEVGDDDEPRRWEWFEAIPEGGGRTATKPVLLDTHVGDVVCHTKRIVAGLSLPHEVANAIIVAAQLHDHGKKRERFQITLGNRDYPDVLWAKSGKKGARLPEPFRHEFGSLLDAQTDKAFKQLSDDMKDLVLHLIAAHHGRARPHFTIDEAIDPDCSSSVAEAMAIETPRRFARLQRKYGRWGLAYLESILRAADWAASAAPSSYADDVEATP